MPFNPIPSTYNPLDTRFLVNFIEPSDYAEGTMIVVSRNSDIHIPHVGTRGEVAIASNQDRTGTITFSIKNTSPFNEIMSGILAASQAGGIFFPVSLDNPSTPGYRIETFAWAQTQPDYTLGQEIGQLDWVLGVVDCSPKLITGQSAVEAALGFGDQLA